MSKLLWIIPLTIIILFAIFIPGVVKENIFVLGGSTSVYNTWNKFSNLNVYENLGYKVHYNSIGSLAALKRVRDGVFDIGYSSYDISLNANDQSIIKKIPLATDFLALVYNLPKSCKLKQPAENKFIEIPKAQIKNLFIKEHPTWNDLRSAVEENYVCGQVGWNQKIIRINRENGSGTRLSFEDFFNLNTSYNFDQQMKSTNQLIKTLNIQSGSLTYFSLSFLTDTIINKAVTNQLGIFIIKEDPQIKQIFNYPKNNTLNNKLLIKQLENYSFKHKFVGFYLKKNQTKLEKLFDFIKLKEFQNILFEMRLKPNA